MLLIAQYWMNGGPLDDDAQRLAIASRCDPDSTRIVSYILGRFFDLRDGKWHHKRVEMELARARRISRERKKAGKIGGLASGLARNRNEAIGEAIAQANGEANVEQMGKQKGTPSPSQSQKEERKKDAAPTGAPDLKAVVFGQGLTWLAKQAGKPEAGLRSVLGKWCKDHGDAAVIEVLAAAQRHGPIEPIGWITKALDERKPQPSNKRDGWGSPGLA